MFGIDGEVLGKVLGGAAAAFIVGLLTWIGNRLNKKDAAEKPPQPAAMGIVLDGDTAMAIRDELRLIHSDMARWRAEDVERDKLEEAQQEIRGLRAQLATASGQTHGNQDEMKKEMADLRKIIEGLKVH